MNGKNQISSKYIGFAYSAMKMIPHLMGIFYKKLSFQRYDCILEVQSKNSFHALKGI